MKRWESPNQLDQFTMKSKPCELSDGSILNVGDIITAYDSGYFRVTAIEYSIQKGPPPYDHWLVSMDRVLDKKNMMPKKGTSQCDSSYCQKVTLQRIFDEETKIKEGYERLRALIKQ